MADDLHDYIEENYPGRFHMIEVSEDGENGSLCTYEKKALN